MLWAHITSCAARLWTATPRSSTLSLPQTTIDSPLLTLEALAVASPTDSFTNDVESVAQAVITPGPAYDGNDAEGYYPDDDYEFGDDDGYDYHGHELVKRVGGVGRTLGYSRVASNSCKLRYRLWLSAIPLYLVECGIKLGNLLISFFRSALEVCVFIHFWKEW